MKEWEPGMKILIYILGCMYFSKPLIGTDKEIPLLPTLPSARTMQLPNALQLTPSCREGTITLRHKGNRSVAFMWSNGEKAQSESDCKLPLYQGTTTPTLSHSAGQHCISPCLKEKTTRWALHITVIATQARDVQTLRVDGGLDGSEGRTETLQTSSAALDSGNLYKKAAFIGIYRGQSAPAVLLDSKSL